MGIKKATSARYPAPKVGDEVLFLRTNVAGGQKPVPYKITVSKVGRLYAYAGWIRFSLITWKESTRHDHFGDGQVYPSEEIMLAERNLARQWRHFQNRVARMNSARRCGITLKQIADARAVLGIEWEEEA
jgi:hypothetical protein